MQAIETKLPYQPKTGARCSCHRGQERDNCPACEGTGLRIDFDAIRSASQFEQGKRDRLAGNPCASANGSYLNGWYSTK